MLGKLRTTESLRKYLTRFRVSRWSSCSEQTDRKSSPAASRLEPNEVIKLNMTLTGDSFSRFRLFWRSFETLRLVLGGSWSAGGERASGRCSFFWKPLVLFVKPDRHGAVPHVTRNRNWTRNKVRLLHGVTDIYSSKHGKLFYHETKQVRYGQHKKKRRRGNGAPARGRPGFSLDHGEAPSCGSTSQFTVCWRLKQIK